MTQKIVDSVSSLKLRQAKPVRLFEQAVEQIKHLILNGQLRPGDKLPSELELSQLLNVSRSSVREALRSLESNGLIQVRSGAGAFVTDDAVVISTINDSLQRLLLRKDLVLQLLQVRGAVECMVVALAAPVITQQKLYELYDLVQQTESVVLNRPEGYLAQLAELDTQFHASLCEAGGNEIAAEILQTLERIYQEDNKAIFYFEKGIMLVEEHHRILDALAAHDAARAEKEMRNHIGRVMQEFRSLR